MWCDLLEILNPAEATIDSMRKEEENMANRNNPWNKCARDYKGPAKTLATILLAVIAILLMVSLSSCTTQAENVSYNLSQEADNFNIRRKITVINLRTDTMLYTMEGNFSIDRSNSNAIDIIGENPGKTYYKHFIRLPDEVTYIVEDMGSTGVNRYAYEVNFNPLMMFVATPTIID